MREMVYTLSDMWYTLREMYSLLEGFIRDLILFITIIRETLYNVLERICFIVSLSEIIHNVVCPENISGCVVLLTIFLQKHWKNLGRICCNVTVRSHTCVKYDNIARTTFTMLVYNDINLTIWLCSIGISCVFRSALLEPKSCGNSSVARNTSQTYTV